MNRRDFLFATAALPFVGAPQPPPITEQELVNAGVSAPFSYVYVPNRCIYVHGTRVIQWSGELNPESWRDIPLNEFYA